MARPKKTNADYFPHDADMRNDPKIKALRRKFEFAGFSIWVMLLEILTDSEYFEYEWSELNIELLAGDFDTEPEYLKEIVEYCIRINLLKKEGNMIYSQKLKDRFENLLQRRSEDRKRKKEQFSTRKTIQGKSDKEKPQSKVKESKVNTLKEYSEKEFLADWNELRKKHLDKPSFLNKITGQDLENFKDLQKDYNREDFRYALIGLFKQKKLPNNNTTMQSNPKHFLTYFNAYLTAYHDKNRELYGKLEKETV